MGWDRKLGWDGDGRSSFQSHTALLHHDLTKASLTTQPQSLIPLQGMDVDAMSPPRQGGRAQAGVSSHTSYTTRAPSLFLRHLLHCSPGQIPNEGAQ